MYLAGSVGLFLYGMKLLSDGLQKVAGKKLKSIMSMMTSHRVMAVITGILITVLINSSTATSVMVVSFVNAGLMTLKQAIGVIMGANIGTTLTAWIVAVFGFSFDISSFALAAVGVSLLFLFSKKEKNKNIGELIMGFGLLFMGLNFLKDSVPDISGHVQVLSFLQRLNSGSILTILLCVLIGIILTIIIQSSAAAMALTITLAYQGWIGVNCAAALILGQNIGTTLTAWMASWGANTNAKRAAWAHILFNLIGTIIAIIFFRPMLNLVNAITPGDIYQLQGKELAESLPTFLAMYHTLFNVINTLIFLPLLDPFAKLIEFIIPDNTDYEEGTYHFTYIGNTMIETPEIYLPVIRDEICKMGDLSLSMMDKYINVLNHPAADLTADMKTLKRDEEYADQMKEQLTAFCVKIIQSSGGTSAPTLNVFIRLLDEFESVTDSCYNLTHVSKQRYEENIQFTDDEDKLLRDYATHVRAFLAYVIEHMDKEFTLNDMKNCWKFENDINNERSEITKLIENKLAVPGADVKRELLVLDIAKHFEHIGDFCMNIAEAYGQAVKHAPILQKRRADK